VLERNSLAYNEDPDGAELNAVEEGASLSGSDVLEVGCGDGRFTAKYWNEPRSLNAIDPDEAAIQSAQSKVPQGLARRVRFRAGGAEDLRFPSQSFDVVIFSWSLCCVQDMKRALREAQRVLRVGGKIVSVMPEAMSSFDMAMLKAFGGKDPIRQGSSDALRALVSSVQDGLFNPFEEKRIFFDTYFDSVDDLIRWLPTVPGSFDRAEFESLSRKSLGDIRRFAAILMRGQSFRVRDVLLISTSSKR